MMWSAAYFEIYRETPAEARGLRHRVEFFLNIRELLVTELTSLVDLARSGSKACRATDPSPSTLGY